SAVRSGPLRPPGAHPAAGVALRDASGNAAGRVCPEGDGQAGGPLPARVAQGRHARADRAPAVGDDEPDPGGPGPQVADRKADAADTGGAAGAAARGGRLVLLQPRRPGGPGDAGGAVAAVAAVAGAEGENAAGGGLRADAGPGAAGRGEEAAGRNLY